MISRLFISVHIGDLEAQPVILDFVKDVFASWARNEGGPLSPEKTKKSAQTPRRNSLDTNEEHAASESQLDHAYLLTTVLAGLSLRSNRTMLADWLDFVMTLSSPLLTSITPLLHPISDALCDQIYARLGSDTTSEPNFSAESALDEDDIPLLLHAAKLVVRRVLPGVGTPSPSAFATPSSDPAGLFGYVTTVLSGESGSGRAAKVAVRLFQDLCFIALGLISLRLAYEGGLGDAARRCRCCPRDI